jgi:hypothetical protein
MALEIALLALETETTEIIDIMYNHRKDYIYTFRND